MSIIRNPILIGIVILLTALAFFSTGFIAGGLEGYRAEASERLERSNLKAAEAEYYRGVYDLCVQQVGRNDVCLKFVKKMIEAEWYDKPSSGWDWPLIPNDPIALNP